MKLMTETIVANKELTGDVMQGARGRFQAALAMIGEIFGPDLREACADMHRVDPLAAELAVRDDILAFACLFMGGSYEALDNHGDRIEVGGVTYRKADATRAVVMTMMGPVEYMRSRYRPTNGKGASIVPTDGLLGIVEGAMTPAAGGLGNYLMSCLTARESKEAFERFCGTGPSTSTLIRMTEEAGRRLEASGEEIEAELRAEEKIPEEAVAVQVSIDGVMMRMNAETEGPHAAEAGWREASCGVVALLDAEGNTLESRCFGRLPEQGKQSLKAQVSREAFHWLGRKEGLKLVAVADGARDNWGFLEGMSPDVMLLDYFHCAQHVKVVADAAFGPDSAAGTEWFDKWSRIVLDEPGGAGKLISAVRYLKGKGTGLAVIEREMKYFQSNRRRMNYHEAKAAGYPVGSGAVEASNKILVSQRMKRSGQRWGRSGGQSVLSFRALLKSGRLDRAWERIAKTWQTWTPPDAANDNLKLARAA